LPGRGRSVLEPDADLHRTLGWFTTIYPVAVPCVTDRNATASEVLSAVHRTLAAVPHHGIGHGLLRYFHGPTALQLAARRPSEIFFSYLGTLRQPPSNQAHVLFDIDGPMPGRETPPGLGHALELRAYRTGGLVQMDWWYDTRKLDGYTVEELTEQFPQALIELTSEAIPLTPTSAGTARGIRFTRLESTQRR
jgi:phthiocerol/phenolphthiocerol synthesis type-I polyketide synthase E